MKKLKLNVKNVQNVLSREDLKSIIGGNFGSGAGTGSDTWLCACPDGTRYSIYGTTIMDAVNNGKYMCAGHMSGPAPDILCAPYNN